MGSRFAGPRSRAGRGALLSVSLPGVDGGLDRGRLHARALELDDRSVLTGHVFARGHDVQVSLGRWLELSCCCDVTAHVSSDRLPPSCPVGCDTARDGWTRPRGRFARLHQPRSVATVTRFAIGPDTLVRLADGGVRVDTRHQLVAPNSVRCRGLDLLLAEVRAGTRSVADALRVHERMTETKIRVLGDRVSRRAAWELALERGVSVQDAEYVAVAKLQADALVSADPALIALAKGVVPVAKLAELLGR